jgi:hypothetical protein
MNQGLRSALSVAWLIIKIVALIPPVGGALLLLFELVNLVDDMLGIDLI